MAHYRTAVRNAAALNTAIFLVEAVAGMKARSLSLIMDSVHNFSDELALVCLFGAFALPLSLSRGLQRSANLLNSVGLIAVCGFVVWQSLERIRQPVTVFGVIPIVVGLLAALGNWGVARLLAAPSEHNAAIRLAYVHNLGDIGVSLAPVVAGACIAVTGRSFFDPVVALAVGAWLAWTTGRDVFHSRDELLWPSHLVCDHADASPAVEG